MKLSDTELEGLARQLRCPEGDEGIKVAEMMNVTNSNIIGKTLLMLDVTQGDAVLEIGPGNAAHVKDVLATADVTYHGVDISSTMIAEAQERFRDKQNVSFSLTDGLALPAEDRSFSKVFTTNTIYFWADPESYMREIARVLKSGGRLCIGFIPKSTMDKIPFAKYGFTSYSPLKVKELIEQAGLRFISQTELNEFITGNDGQQIEREIVITVAEKVTAEDF